MTTDTTSAPNFIRNQIRDEIEAGRDGKIVTRFPPEPNGFLHIGHAKSICLNFGLAEQFGGDCHLRFDDTNPAKEEQAYIDAIKEDVNWLGFQWSGEVRFASDYFDQLYAWAQHLIGEGKAYVDDLSPDEIREYRGTLTQPGRPSPYRERSPEENLDLLERMRRGEFAEGEKVLRARIDMASPNINMRDPILYRIRHASHHQTGDKWKIYPSYDFTHGQSDAIEGISHSICTLEFEDHRPLYEWFLANLPVPATPRQIEFARLNLNYTLTSKRKLKLLVDQEIVDGWDDPRLPTISGMRRRGYTPASVRKFCDMIGVTRADGGLVEIGMLYHAIRSDLEDNAPRAMAVLKPLKVVLTNVPEGHEETYAVPGHPARDDMPVRQIPFGRELYIDQDDFMEEPPKKFFRLAPGKEVRLRNSYVIRCDEVIKDAAGEVSELRCSVDFDTLGKNPEGRKVKGVIHWVSAEHGVPMEVRLYDNLFLEEQPDKDKDADFLEHLNPESLVVRQAIGEPSLAEVTPESRFQFERVGYFCADRHACRDGKLVFNRTVSLKDTWAKTQKKEAQKQEAQKSESGKPEPGKPESGKPDAQKKG
uniref:glutamine--tRNA ligase/YqeY domain fusion protein n=1 Tax=uncultured Halomonas sp. TaxID=173971 RepID=UPI002633CA4C|nr:glutamine--tRNA ligase/YqeY domain fusion protein [uncultured Halomonas sp.]